MRWRLDSNRDLPSSFDFVDVGCVYDRDRFVVPFSLVLTLPSLKSGSVSIVIGVIHPRFDFFGIRFVYDRDRFVVPFSLALTIALLKSGSASIVIGVIHPVSTSLI